MWFLYEIVLILGLLGYLPRALWRRRLPHRGWSMRLGRYPTRVTKALRGRSSLWVHAVSVGEVLAVHPLLRALAEAFPQNPVVVSTITPSGFDVASKQVVPGGQAIYFPLDLGGCVTRALEAIHPRILVLVELEIWPNIIRLARARGVPVAVVNGRISARAFERYRLVKRLLAGTLRRMNQFLMQSQTDADRILQLGAPKERIHVVGNLKWDASLGMRPSPQTIQETAARLGLDGQDIVIVAGSTHRGEEPLLLQAFHTVRTAYPQTRLIIAPRHLERLAEVETLIRHTGFTPLRCSDTPHASGWDVGIVDAFGQLPRYYGLATVVVIGGSLIPRGGQNPLEAASLGKPIVFGPFMQNFEAIAHQLLAHHAARQLANGSALTSLLHELLSQRAAAEAMGVRAQELTERFCGATQRTLEALQPLIETRDMRQET